MLSLTKHFSFFESHFDKLSVTQPLLFLLLIPFPACRKDIKVKLPEYQENLVVEAQIETGLPATVLLSHSVPFFGDFDYTHPENAFVKGAFVTVSDGTVIDTLVEQDPSKGYFYFGSKVIGQLGKTYYLTIVADGKTYTAETFLNPPVKLDSLYFKGEQDSLGFIWAHMHEPPGIGQNYRWFAKRLNKDLFYAAPFTSVFDDKFIDGKDFDFAYDRGHQPNELEENSNDPERGYYKRGDTVVVKFCTLGRKEYLFWFSYYLNKQSNGNPFSAPTNIQSTIVGQNVMGAFCGYSPSFDTLIIKKK